MTIEEHLRQEILSLKFALDLAQQENRRLAIESVSQRCARLNIQNCQFCERASCGDNTNPEIMNLKEKVDAG